MTMRNALSISIMALLGGVCLLAQVKEFRPVTEAALRNPAPGDWLNWRRTDNAWGYSPLDQITRQNVTQLQLAWSWAMDRSEEHTSELQSLAYLVCRLLLEKKKSPITVSAPTST